MSHPQVGSHRRTIAGPTVGGEVDSVRLSHVRYIGCNKWTTNCYHPSQIERPSS